MPENDKPNVDAKTGEDKGPAPAIDPAQLQTAIDEGLARAMESQRQREAEVSARPTAVENPLAPIIDPIINPRLKNIDTKANAAYDASIFYATHPEAVEHQAEVEGAFNTMIQNGTPLTHQTIWEWYKGKNEDKFFQKRVEADKKKLEAAKEFTTVDGGVRPQGGERKQAFDASDEELKGGLKDVAF